MADAGRPGLQPDPLLALSRGLAELVQRVRPSLVRLLNGRAGAGVIVHEEGLLLTNAHVIQRRRPRVEDWRGNEFEGELLALDRRRDLAALAIDAGEHRPLPLADAAQVRPGDWALALGHPLGVLGGATAGSVIAVGRDLAEVPTGETDWLALALHLRPGHSGGPVVNDSGELIGLNSRMAGPDVGLAVPVHELKAFVKGSLGASAAQRRSQFEAGTRAHIT